MNMLVGEIIRGKRDSFCAEVRQAPGVVSGRVNSMLEGGVELSGSVIVHLIESAKDIENNLGRDCKLYRPLIRVGKHEQFLTLIASDGLFQTELHCSIVHSHRNASFSLRRRSTTAAEGIAGKPSFLLAKRNAA